MAIKPRLGKLGIPTRLSIIRWNSYLLALISVDWCHETHEVEVLPERISCQTCKTVIWDGAISAESRLKVVPSLQDRDTS